MKNAPSFAARLVGVVAGMLAVLPAPASADAFVDLGLNSMRIEADIATVPDKVTSTQSGLHLGAGLRKDLTRGSIGARIEFDDLDGDLLLAVRALDYRRHLSERFAVTAFAGAARLDLATPAHGYYFGGGVELKELWPSWNLAVDVRFGDTLARDNLSPSDEQGSRPDNFYDLTGLSLYLSRRF